MSNGFGQDNRNGRLRGVQDVISNINLDTEKVNVPLDSLFVQTIGNEDKTRFWNEAWCDKFPQQLASEGWLVVPKTYSKTIQERDSYIICD